MKSSLGSHFSYLSQTICEHLYVHLHSMKFWDEWWWFTAFGLTRYISENVNYVFSFFFHMRQFNVIENSAIIWKSSFLLTCLASFHSRKKKTSKEIISDSTPFTKYITKSTWESNLMLHQRVAWIQICIFSTSFQQIFWNRWTWSRWCIFAWI